MSNAFMTIKMCYVYNQWYDISCATLYVYVCVCILIMGFDRKSEILAVLFRPQGWDVQCSPISWGAFKYFHVLCVYVCVLANIVLGL